MIFKTGENMIQEQILENENNTNVTRGTEAVVAEEYPPNDTMERSEGESRRAIQLSDHFTTGKLLRYTLPSMIMMVFTSIYGVVDGYFVSNFAGKVQFTAVNFIMPFLMILGCVGFMFGTGGSALIALTMGQGKKKRAEEQFSMIIYASIVLGIIISLIGQLILPSVARFLGGSGEMLQYAIRYARIILLAIPAYVLQYEFQCLFSTAEKPKLGLYVTVAAGCTNMVLDWLFVAVFHWSVEGAAAATALSQAVGGILPLIYFVLPNSSTLRLGRARFSGHDLAKVCGNGSSELMSNIAMSLVSMLYNTQLLRYIGQDGIAAYGVLMYVNLIFLAVFIGFSVGTAPVISFHYGAQHHDELHGILTKSFRIIAVFAACMYFAAEGLSDPLARLYVGYDERLLALTKRAFFYFAFSFLFAGFSIFSSSLFTALNNGAISAAISFLRALVFQVLAVLMLPIVLGTDGIWLSIVVAEVAALIVSAVFLLRNRTRYGY